MKKILLGLILSLCLISQGYCADQFVKEEPLGTRNASDIDTYIGTNNAALDRLVYTYRQGCSLVYASASTITVNSGALALPNAAGSVVRWRRNTSNTTVSWADIDIGAEANGTTYYIFALADTDATTFTVKISTNSSAPTGATYYRRLGSFYNDASSNITQIVNDDNSGDIAFAKGTGNYYKIQTGSTSLNQGTTTTITFPTTWENTNYIFVDSFTNQSVGVSACVRSKATGNLSYYNNAGEAVTLDWLAIGQVLAQ